MIFDLLAAPYQEPYSLFTRTPKEGLPPMDMSFIVRWIVVFLVIFILLMFFVFSFIRKQAG
ncbi:hypothetical protein ALPO108162_11465 [Alicyclobacillus pomorum]